MAPAAPPVNNPNYRLLAAYGLLGLGLPSFAAGAILFRMVFLPGKSSPALAPFSIHHPAAAASAALCVIGGVMCLVGFGLLKPVERDNVFPRKDS
jgi:hypothetical protein